MVFYGINEFHAETWIHNPHFLCALNRKDIFAKSCLFSSAQLVVVAAAAVFVFFFFISPSGLSNSSTLHIISLVYWGLSTFLFLVCWKSVSSYFYSASAQFTKWKWIFISRCQHIFTQQQKKNKTKTSNNRNITQVYVIQTREKKHTEQKLIDCRHFLFSK